VLHFDQFPALTCNNCSRHIELPRATHSDTSLGLGAWPMDGAARNFLCPVCKHVFVYSAHDVRPTPVQADPRTGNKPYNVVLIEVPCGVGNCGSLLRIRTLMAFDADPILEAPEVVALSTAHEIPCDKGHIQNGPAIRTGTAYNAEFDPLWTMGEW
jgi:hypothetical protein